MTRTLKEYTAALDKSYQMLADGKIDKRGFCNRMSSILVNAMFYEELSDDDLKKLHKAADDVSRAAGI